MIKITVRVEAQTETHTQSQEESPYWVVNANEKIFHCTDQRHTCLNIKPKIARAMSNIKY